MHLSKEEHVSIFKKASEAELEEYRIKIAQFKRKQLFIRTVAFTFTLVIFSFLLYGLIMRLISL